MSISVTIEPDKGFAKAAKALKNLPNAFPKAAATAINKSLVTGRKVAAQGIRARYAIASATVKQNMDLKRATRGNLEGSLDAKGTMIPATEFSPKQKWKSVGGRKHQFVSIKVIKGQRKVVSGAFMAKGRVWEREGSDQYPIKPISVIGVPFMIAYQGISKKIQDTIGKALQKNLDHEVNAFLSGVRK